MFFANLNKLRRTLAFRLTLWYAVIFSLSACLAFLMFYMLIITVIRGQVDRELQDQINQFSTLYAIRGIDAVKETAVLEAQAAGEKQVFFRLLSPSGELFSSSNMSYWRDIPVDTKAIRRLLEGEQTVIDTIEVTGRKHKVRTAYSFIGPGIILHLGQSMQSEDRLLQVFRRIFILTMGALFLLAVVAGWFMARRALRGVASITRTAQQISARSLQERVPVPGDEDEIDQLAITFNAMLDRIQELVTGIKEMSDNIAHDLKSPITRIRGLAEITLTTAGGIAEYEAMAADTIEDCDRLLDMINTMLMISRTDAGVDPGALESMDVAKMIRDACELMAPIAEDKAIALTCIAEGAVPLAGDRRMVQRMVANLLDNAIKYTPRSGTITVSCRVDAEHTVLAVADTGLGIEASELLHIFDRFYRCDASRSEPGTGLGLSLVRAVAVAHGGEVSVTSAPGRGSTFSVILPRVFPS